MKKPIAALASLAMLAQAMLASAQLAEFEVVSIKPNKSGERMYYGLRNGTLTVRNMTAKGLIQTAYGKRDFQIAGGPAWLATETFDIDAKAERPLKATHDMEKSILADRFHLELHRETRQTTVYSLAVARGGLKMKPSADQSDPQKGGPKEMGPGRIAGEGIPLYVIVNLLSNMLGRTVVDHTGLTGKFDVNLLAAPDPAPGDIPDHDLIDAALLDAVEKQLGLTIKSIRAPDEILVIDRIERPAAN